MDDVTRILEARESGDTRAAEGLLPLAYDELRRMAANKMASERAGHTLQPTALVHEAYLRLVDPDGEEPHWNSRAHFFAAAAEAMRRILIESARRKLSKKRGERPEMTSFDEQQFETEVPSERLLAVDEAVTQLEREHPDFAAVVKLRYFAGMTVPEIAAALGNSESTVNRTWASAKVWLYREIGEE
ncbi:ECF-type sigma factor [Haloferula chungangensis]|uniref:ECF-type sigma factor n=1 Tax=Haloferula chungangensis TaxID=1048331 RepID=A0ABW2L8R9_9BACT